MERHIVEILVILMSEYPEGNINPDEFEPLTKDLFGQGYTQHEVETALFWFNSRIEMRANRLVTDEMTKNSFRVLHDIEKTVISPQAYGYLLNLSNLDILSLEELDSIIEKAVLLGGRKVDIDDMKLFIAAHIMDSDGMNAPSPGLSYYLRTPPDQIQ